METPFPVSAQSVALVWNWMFSFALNSPLLKYQWHCGQPGVSRMEVLQQIQRLLQPDHTRAGLRWEKSRSNSISATELQSKTVCCWTAISIKSHARDGVSVWVGVRENKSVSEIMPGLQIKTFFSLGGDWSSKLRCKPESHCYSSQHTELNQIPMC